MSLTLIVSPAKKMEVREGPPYVSGLPRFLERAEVLARAVSSLSFEEAQALWHTSEALTRLNYERFQSLDLTTSVTAAALAYQGIQYTHLAAEVMSEDELAWTQAHLRILSGFYGLVTPTDGVVPYRLEMGARLRVGETATLYTFWGDALARSLAEEGTTVVVNVASKEYAKAVLPYAAAFGMRVLTCLFGEMRAGRFRQISTEAKAARGTFCRWCAEREVTDTDELRAFSERGYALSEERGDADTLVFVRGA